MEIPIDMNTQINHTDNKFWQSFGEMQANIANIESRLTDIDKKLEKIDLGSIDVKIESILSDEKNHEHRIRALEENQSKIVWFVILAVIGAILKLVIFQK